MKRQLEKVLRKRKFGIFKSSKLALEVKIKNISKNLNSLHLWSYLTLTLKAIKMGGTQQSKLTDVSLVENLSFLEEGDFAKLYKGYLSSGNTRMPVAIKVPKVPDHIRKEKSNNITNKFRQSCISCSIRVYKLTVRTKMFYLHTRYI